MIRSSLVAAASRSTASAVLGCILSACAATGPAAHHADRGVAPALAARLQHLLDSLRVADALPGATLGVALADGSRIALATGWADTAGRVAMTPASRMLQGSVGKTYVAAVAMQLVHEGRLDLDAPIARYLGDAPWFARLPNAAGITVRQLMNHTSGLVRYEFQPAATRVMREEPMRRWTPEDRLAFVFDLAPPFAPGAGWEYSDTNYIVLGMIIERITGADYHDEVRRRILQPLGLRNTVPSDRPDVPGIVNGYAGPRNELGGYDATVSGGRLVANPQFEWTGGGMASTADDLAVWGRLLYEGRAFDPALLPTMLDGVPARLGPDVRYGLGVIIRRTALGETWGHSGFFPGYATEMLYFPRLRTAVAVQINRTDPYPRTMPAFLVQVARAIEAAGVAAPAGPRGR